MPTPDSTTDPTVTAQRARTLRRATMPDGKVDLRSLDRETMAHFLGEKGWKRFRATQIYKWIWQHGITDFGEMTNIAKEARAELAEVAAAPDLELVSRQESADGTIKYLWRCTDGSEIESVMIPDEDRPDGLKDRRTLCVSTQVGCAMACTFCLTGDMGLKRNLRPGEIASQPLQVQQDLGPDRRITNIVMMGMGEPLHNYDNLVLALGNLLDEDALGYSHRRITVSTVGLVPAMKKLVDDTPVNLAVSLNATTEAQRLEVMPITRKYSMAELMAACRDLPLPKAKRITFEYVMMAGFNDSMEDARRLVGLMRGVKSKVNLIPYNENPDRDIKCPSRARVKAFQDHLVNKGVHCSVRVTRGKDISAACGQLGKAAEQIAAQTI